MSFGANGFYTGHVEGTRGGGAGLDLVYRPQGSVDISAAVAYQATDYDQFYVTQRADPAIAATYGRRYLFSALDQDQLSFTFRLNWVVTPNLSLQWYAQSFVAAGDYDRFSYVRTPSAYDYATYGEDGSTISYDEATNRYTATAGPGVEPVTFTNPDFRVRSLRSNLVLRWEYLGSRGRSRTPLLHGAVRQPQRMKHPGPAVACYRPFSVVRKPAGAMPSPGPARRASAPCCWQRRADAVATHHGAGATTMAGARDSVACANGASRPAQPPATPA